ncbi:unnamed protein product, partial [Didymodactylos carnosus]
YSRNLNIVGVPDHVSDKAIEWYTRDSFVYRLINHAFRTEDIALWYLFRFYIIDLCKQLESVHRIQQQQQQKTDCCLKLYRGQSQMPSAELNYLKDNIGRLVSTNGFLSTSKSIAVAKQFIGGASDKNERFRVVLYEITVDCSLKDLVFVDIDKYLSRSHENEILFNINSVFQIEQVYQDDDQEGSNGVWTIQMKATDEGTADIKEQLELIRKKFETCSSMNNILFGRLLLDMGHYTKAESYFQMMLNVLPKKHKDRASIYDHIGDVHMHTTNWNEAFKCFSQAYEIKMTSCHHRYLSETLNNIGNYYKAIEYFDMACSFYESALNCEKTDENNNCIIQLNLCSIYLKQKRYDQALDLCLTARDKLQQVQPALYTEIIYCHGIIGDIYFNQQEYTTAESFYFTAFKMSKIYLVIGDRLRTKCIEALIDLYEKQDRRQCAIAFCREQLSFHEKYLSVDNSHHTATIAHLLLKLCELCAEDESKKLSYCEKALKISVENICLEYELITKCLMLVGHYYKDNQVKDKARSHYLSAKEIQVKIYPPEHPIHTQTQELIDSEISIFFCLRPRTRALPSL